MRQALDGVKAATFPVVAQALADEARYGYRPWKETERLAGSLVLLTGERATSTPRRPDGVDAETYAKRGIRRR